jgi:hypothetical protein
VSLHAGWFKSLLPKSALTVEEEAWNAYPYTKTRYTCPFVEKFSLEIETYYYADDGHQENVFGLSGSDLRNRVIGMYMSVHVYTELITVSLVIAEVSVCFILLILNFIQDVTFQMKPTDNHILQYRSEITSTLSHRPLINWSLAYPGC